MRSAAEYKIGIKACRLADRGRHAGVVDGRGCTLRCTAPEVVVDRVLLKFLPQYVIKFFPSRQVKKAGVNDYRYYAMSKSNIPSVLQCYRKIRRR